MEDIGNVPVTVSAVIGTYNRTELLLNRSLASVLRQTVPLDEIIIVGDGTEQATVDALSAMDDPRIKFWNLPHETYPKDYNDCWYVAGITARNFGLAQVSSDWTCVLDDDDEWTDDHVEVLLGEAMRTGVDIAYGTLERFHPDGITILSVDGAAPLGPECHIACSIFRTSMGYRYEWECLDRGLPEDCDIVIRMRDDGRTWSFIDQVVYRYYPHPRWLE